MNYITFNEIIEVNGLLEEKGLNFKVHLRDACGKQSCWIEPLGNCACEGRYEEMYQVVEEIADMNYITFNEIIEVNGLLEEKGLNFKVHLRDACGKQSCWIEPLGNCACEGRYEEMYQVVEEYFRRKGQKITFDETKLNFFAV